MFEIDPRDRRDQPELVELTLPVTQTRVRVSPEHAEILARAFDPLDPEARGKIGELWKAYQAWRTASPSADRFGAPEVVALNVVAAQIDQATKLRALFCLRELAQELQGGKDPSANSDSKYELRSILCQLLDALTLEGEIRPDNAGALLPGLCLFVCEALNKEGLDDFHAKLIKMPLSSCVNALAISQGKPNATRILESEFLKLARLNEHYANVVAPLLANGCLDFIAECDSFEGEIFEILEVTAVSSQDQVLLPDLREFAFERDSLRRANAKKILTLLKFILPDGEPGNHYWHSPEQLVSEAMERHQNVTIRGILLPYFFPQWSNFVRETMMSAKQSGASSILVSDVRWWGSQLLNSDQSGSSKTPDDVYSSIAEYFQLARRNAQRGLRDYLGVRPSNSGALAIAILESLQLLWELKEEIAIPVAFFGSSVAVDTAGPAHALEFTLHDQHLSGRTLDAVLLSNEEVDVPLAGRNLLKAAVSTAVETAGCGRNLVIGLGAENFKAMTQIEASFKTIPSNDGFLFLTERDGNDSA